MQHLFTLSTKQLIRRSNDSLRVRVLQSFFFWEQGCLSFPVFSGGGGWVRIMSMRVRVVPFTGKFNILMTEWFE